MKATDKGQIKNCLYQDSLKIVPVVLTSRMSVSGKKQRI